MKRATFVPPRILAILESIQVAEENREPKEYSMAVGWARDGAVQDQIDASVESEVSRARSRLARGESLTHCEDCEEAIPGARRLAVPGVRRCVRCQAEADEQERIERSPYNRRGSKDSQLK